MSQKNIYDNPKQAIQLSYLAGIVDGEGCIRIDKQKASKANNRLTPYHAPHIGVGMTDERIPQLFKKVFGGSLRVECVPSGRKPLFRWAITGRHKIIPCLEALLPYLIVKRPQAEILIRLAKGMKIPFNRQKGVSPEELQWREDLNQQVLKLNATGAAATTEREGIREDEATVWTNGKPLEEDSKKSPRQLKVVGL